MRTIVCTGTSGSERIPALRKLALDAASADRTIDVIDMWQVMRDVASAAVDEATILNWNPDKRAVLLRDAYSEVSNRLASIQQEEGKGPERTAVVATHAVFYWRSTFMEELPQRALSGLSPDCFITIIHNIRDVKLNLDKDPHGRFKDYTLADVLQWRDREISETAQWARNSKKDHFVVPRLEPDSLYGLVITPGATRVYVSYPMSYVTKAQMDGAAALVADLRKAGYVVFDPGSIDDAQFIGQLERQRKKRQGDGAHYSADDLLSLAADVGDHTAKLDYLLIDQSHSVVIRYPSVTYRRYMQESGTVVPGMYVPLSAGVICEMVHGDREGKRVHALWLARGIRPSPFFSHHCGHISYTKGNLLAHMRKYDPPHR